jgi:putative membrane protein
MEESSSRSSAPMRLILRLLLTIILVWGLSTGLERLFFVDGGLPAYIIIGSLLTLMNVIVRPLLHLILLPFKLFMGFIVLILTNGIFLWLTEKIANQLDPEVVTMQIDGGIGGWIVVMLIFGIANWIFKEVLR